MKKRLTGIIICLLMVCISLFAGCSWIQTDPDKYYNATIVEIADKNGSTVAVITSGDLINGYQNYGYMYEQSYGYSTQEAVDLTLKLLQNRKITVLAAEEKFDIDQTGKGLSDIEKTYIWDNIKDSLKANVDYFYEQIVGEASEETQQGDNVTFNGYDKQAVLDYEGEELVIKKTTTATDPLQDYAPGYERDYNKQSDKDALYTNLVNSLYNDNYKSAFNKYFQYLKSKEEGRNLSTDAKSVFYREIDALYKQCYENYLVSKYSYENENKSDISSVEIQDVLDLYASKVRADYTQYQIEQDSSYGDDVSSDLNNVYYFKSDSDTQYFTVANILFKFTEDEDVGEGEKSQTALYNEYKEKLKKNDGSYDIDDYNADLGALYNSIEPVIREYDEIEDQYKQVENSQELTVDQIIEEKIEKVLKSAQITGNTNHIGDTINELIYTYNQDPGMLNAQSNYVIGVDKDGNAVSNFVEEFNKAGLKLYNDGQGQIGDMIVAKSSFGIHVLVYTGKCENLFDGIDSSFSLKINEKEGEIDGERAIEILSNTRVNPLVDKTYFDVLYEELGNDNFSYYETAHLNTLRAQYDIKVYRSNIPDSLK